MRKAISLFLAAAVLCLSTTAMATPTAGTVTGMRKSANNTLQGSEVNTSLMPCFRPGDTISFNVGSVISGEELTVISYKNGETASDSTVQYINQYTTSDTSQLINYTIRNQNSGVYKLVFNGSTSGTATFYYKVGKATVSVLNNNNNSDGSYSNSAFSGGTFDTTTRTSVSGYGTPYVIRQANNTTWSVGFVGRVTVDSGDISLSDLGATPGFAIKEGAGEAKEYGYGQTGQKTVATLEGVTNTAKQVELGGSYSFIYGLTLYDVASEETARNITVQAELDVPTN